jgi:hypothetical protein
MKITEIEKGLEKIKQQYGDIEVNLEIAPSDIHNGEITQYPHFFIVPEEYTKKDGGWQVNIRAWPY